MHFTVSLRNILFIPEIWPVVFAKMTCLTVQLTVQQSTQIHNSMYKTTAFYAPLQATSSGVHSHNT